MKIEEWKKIYCTQGKYFSHIDHVNRSIEQINNISKEFKERNLERFLMLKWNEYEKNISRTKEILANHNKLNKENIHSSLKLLNNEIIKYDKNKFVSLFFSNTPSLNYYMAVEIANKAYNHTVLPNVFTDDTSRNHMVTFEITNTHDISFMLDLLTSNRFPDSNFNTYKIYGIDISLIVDLCSYNGTNICFGRPNSLSRFCGNSARRDKDPIKIIEVRDTIDIIMDKNIFINEFELSYYLRENVMTPMNDMYKLVRYSNSNPDKHIYLTLGKDFSQEKNKIYNELIKEDKLKVKWKSEKAMFDLISKYFEDAIYQYRPKWLKPQSLDVFVPSINTAFEYQGEQHFKSVDFFGGKEQFIKQRERDLKKFNLCKENNVNLIEWSYEESITKSVLNKKLKIKI